MPAQLWCLPLLTLALVEFGAAARADYLYFANGGQAELSADVRSGVVTVQAPAGVLTFPQTAFRAVVPGERLADSWRLRRANSQQTASALVWFEAGWWALEHGLTPEAVESFRAGLSSPGSSDHAPLSRVGRMLGRLDAPVSDRPDESLTKLLGTSGWTRLEGRHVTLWHQADSTASAERLDVLDRVITSYYLSLAAQGIELPVPPERLTSVWFSRQADYVATLRRIEAAPFATTQGFYHPGYRVVFAFDTRSSYDQAGPRLDLEHRRQSQPTTDQLAEINRQSLLLDLRWRSIDLGIAAHETVHQLVAASGLAARFDDWPIWLHEGFSAQFEVVRGGRWAGIGRANDLRLPDWRSIHLAPQLAPLLHDTGLTQGYNRDHYAESWALVHFLRKTHPTEFVNYLTLLHNVQPDDRKPASETVFTAAFGSDLNRLQAEWRAFLRTLTTPLEDHIPRTSWAKSR